MLRGEKKKLIPSCQGKFGLDFRKNFFTHRAVQPWRNLWRAVVESPSIWRDLKQGCGTWGYVLVVALLGNGWTQ